jgi:TPR repeat protein
MAVDKENYELAKAGFIIAFTLGDKDRGMRGKYYVECLEKNAKSCWLLGNYAENGIGGNQDYKLARVAYQLAIDLGNTDSLGDLAHLYDKGLGGERSYFKATKLFEKSCNVGTTAVNYANCFNAGNQYSDGKGVRQDNFKAVKLYRKACNGEYASACNNLGWMYYYGKGVRQSKSMAQMYYGKGCDLGSDMACENYAKNNR